MSSNEAQGGIEDTSQVMEMLSANLPQSVFSSSAPDPRLQRALQETERTNKITPVLKEELRCKILAKRLEKGEPELETAFGEPRKYELTEEEQRKRERRKEQNRRAAKKCREKRKMKNLSDAEKSELIVEDNQKLKSELSLLRHNKRILENFCLEHILKGQCKKVKMDMTINDMLKSMMDDDTERCAGSHNEGCYVSGPGAIPSNPHCLPAPTTQENATSMPSKAQTFSYLECSATPGLVSNPSVAANQSALQLQPEHVASDSPLQILPIHEVSSLLPTDVDFNSSDSASDSSPSLLSPLSLFISVPDSADCAANIPFSRHDITPSTSFSSNDTIITPSAVSNHTAPSSSFIDSNIKRDSSSRNTSFSDSSIVSSTPVPHVSISEHSYKVNAFQEYTMGANTSDVVLSTDVDQCNARSGMLRTRLEATNHSEDSTIEIGETTVAIPDAIVNTALLSDIPGLINYLIEQSHDGNNLSTCNGDSPTQTGPISPMTPLSPSSVNFSLSPSSPIQYSTELASYQIMDPNLGSGRFESSTAGIPIFVPVTTSVSQAMTPTRPIVRRSSSTASVPSPYVTPLSTSLSPPPSVPSPSSTGVPESPSILTGYTVCDDNRYMPQYSPVSAVTSGMPSPVRFLDQLPDEDFNNSG